MNARQAFLDDPTRVADFGLLADEVDADAPTVTRERAVALVRACLENETAGAFGQSARIWADSLLNEVSDNQAAAALVLLAGTVSMSIHRFLSQHLENYIEAEANRLLAEMDPDEAEACL